LSNTRQLHPDVRLRNGVMPISLDSVALMTVAGRTTVLGAVPAIVPPSSAWRTQLVDRHVIHTIGP
jgi:hypothetical protein